MSEAANNLAIWSSVQATDPKFTKEFNRGGGFRGTSTNATWLAKQATKTFGPMGIGWGIKILDESLMAGAGDDKIHRVKIQLWYIWNGQRGEIEHYGLTTFVGKNKNGLFTDEEAAKKSLTDAMSKALSMLGFAADVHLGMYDDNKYVNAVEAHFIKQEKAARDERAAAAKATVQEKTDGQPADAAQEAPAEKADEPVSEEAPEPVQQDEPEAPVVEHEDPAPEEKPKGEFDDFTEEQMEIIMKIDVADEISTIVDLMTSPEVQAVLEASGKVDEAKIKLHGKKRLKQLGWPGKRPRESMGEKSAV